MVSSENIYEKRSPSKQRGGVFDPATLTVVVLAAALCFCWPRASAVGHVRELAPDSISYVHVEASALRMIREPLLFLRYEPISKPVIDDGATDNYARFSATSWQAPVALPSAHGPSSVFNLNSVLQAPHALEEGRYFPAWDTRPTFAASPHTPLNIEVVFSPSLQALGMTLALSPKAFRDFKDSSWSSTLELSGGDAKHPEDVFVIESSGNTELDLRLVRKFYECEFDEPGTAWRGRVSVGHRVE